MNVRESKASKSKSIIIPSRPYTWLRSNIALKFSYIGLLKSFSLRLRSHRGIMINYFPVSYFVEAASVDIISLYLLI